MKLQALIKKKDLFSKRYADYWLGFLQVIFGSLFLGLMAQLSIPLPFTPVPLSMQPLAIFILAILLGSRKAPLAVLTYLTQATWGLPVLAGGLSNSLWMIGPKAGYLIGFVIAAYLIATLIENQKKISFCKSWMIFFLGEVTILFCGTLWLSYFVGLEKAIIFGVLPFLPGALVKISIATCLLKSFILIKSRK